MVPKSITDLPETIEFDSKSIDVMLKGGLRLGTVVEIAGEAGSGKT